MNMWKFFKKVLGLLLFLFLRIPGIMWLTCAAALVGGIALLVRQFLQHESAIPVLLCTAAVVALFCYLAVNLPNIRVVDLLYR